MFKARHKKIKLKEFILKSSMDRLIERELRKRDIDSNNDTGLYNDSLIELMHKYDENMSTKI